MTRILSFFFVTLLAVFAGIPGVYAQDSEPEIQAFYLVPSDKQPNADYVAAINDSLSQLRNWFSWQMGGPTFTVNHSVTTLQMSKEARWYYWGQQGVDFPQVTGNPDGEFLNRLFGETEQIENLPKDVAGREISRVRVYFFDLGMPCFGDTDFPNINPLHDDLSGNGVAVLGSQVLKILVGDASRTGEDFEDEIPTVSETESCLDRNFVELYNNPKGIGLAMVAHELGHAFGLQDQNVEGKPDYEKGLMEKVLWGLQFLSPEDRTHLLTDEWAKKFFKLPIVNGASFLPTSLSRGTIASIFGSNLATTTVAADSLPLPTELAGTQVLVRGLLAPLYFVSPGQINFLVPFEIPENEISVNVQVRVNGSTVQETILQLSTSSPGIFNYPRSNTFNQAIVTNINWQLVDDDNLMMPGNHYIIFATGLGEVAPEIQSGQAAGTDVLHHTVTPSEVWVNGKQMPVFFSGLVPGFVGLYQVNFTYLPDGEPLGWSNHRELVLKSSGHSHTVVVLLGE